MNLTKKMVVSCETIQLLLSFANKINVNNNYISIKYKQLLQYLLNIEVSLMGISHISKLSKENHAKIIKMT